jgi:tetratricopeptide (TPR) repeat protein
MKLFRTALLGTALALGSATMVATPLLAQKKAKPASMKLSEPVRKALGEAQAAQQKNDLPAALAAIQQAKAAMQTPDDRAMTGNLYFSIVNAGNDLKQKQEALDLWLGSGAAAPEQAPQIALALGQISYQLKDYVKADAALNQAIALNVADPSAHLFLAETKVKLGRPAEAIPLLQKVADQGRTVGKPVPEDWLRRGVSIASSAKLPQQTADITMTWLRDYPSPTAWRDTLEIYRTMNASDAELELDVMRLQRAVGALRGDRDYGEYAEVTQLRFPAEAKAVLDEGQAKGQINISANRSLRELSQLANSKLAGDKASLSKNPGNGRSALNNADAFASHGDYATAITLYRKALQLGGVDAATVNLRMAAAMVRSGQKDQARPIFETISGQRQALARYWLIFLNQPAGGSAAPAA